MSERQMVDSPLHYFCTREKIPGMGRRRTRLEFTPEQRAELRRRSSSERDPRLQERLKFAEHAATGDYTLEELAVKIGRSRSTLQNWLEKFSAGGLAGLLERDAPPGRTSPLAEGRIQSQLDAGLRSGRLRTAAQVATWLHEQHGHQRARKSIYYWLRRRNKVATAKRPRSCKASS